MMSSGATRAKCRRTDCPALSESASPARLLASLAMRSTRSALRSSAVMAMRSPEGIATAGRYQMPAMRRAILLLLMVSLLFIAGAARAKDDAYEIFLPSNYDAKKTWPLVYALDARGDADAPLQSLRTAADELGFIIASSYKSASDESNTPNITAMREMWSATHAKFSIDDKRAYIAGFSGTVRSAVLLAQAAPGTISAIIGAGAGFPPGTEPNASMKFAFFGTVGTRDFNYSEMQELEKKLTGAGIEHRIEEFDGVHEWMPPALGREALAWLTIREMRNGTRPRDAALIEKLWEEDRSEERRVGKERRSRGAAYH